MGSLAHWMLPAPGSAVSQEASAVLQSPRPVACSCLSIPFSIFFLFAGQSRGTALFACPGAEQGTFSSGWGLLLLEPQNLGRQGCCVCFEQQLDAPVPSLCCGVLWVTWQVTPKMQLGVMKLGVMPFGTT